MLTNVIVLVVFMFIYFGPFRAKYQFPMVDFVNNLMPLTILSGFSLMGFAFIWPMIEEFLSFPLGRNKRFFMRWGCQS